MTDAAANDGTSFEELNAFTTVSPVSRSGGGNVLKAGRCSSRNPVKISIEAGDQDRPTIILHRAGEIVEKAEFICPCGRTATLNFDYGEE